MFKRKFLNEDKRNYRWYQSDAYSIFSGHDLLICFDFAFTAAYVPFDVHFARNSPFGVGLKYFAYVFFFTKQSQKKVDPHFADRFGQSGRPTLLASSGLVYFVYSPFKK